MVNAQQWLDRRYPLNNRNEIIELDLSKGQVKRWDGHERILKGDLKFDGFNNLKKLKISSQKITSLYLNYCKYLTKLDCSFNQIDSLDLDQNIKLEKLNIGHNNFPFQNPTWLKNLINLKSLELDYSNFSGSLEFVKNMNKLETFNAYDCNFTCLEYLPNSLRTISFSREILIELVPYNYNLLLWQLDNQELMIKAGREPAKFDHSQVQLVKVMTIPELLQEQEEKHLNSVINYSSEFNYSSFVLRNEHPFIWEINQGINFTKVLPTRLYNISTNQVIETNKSELLNYVTLSYVWGDRGLEENQLSETQKEELDQVTSSVCYSNSNKMTKLGYKAWKKAISACQYLDFDYLWIDQLCINQNDLSDKGNEVRKMGGCYGNCSATLISIDSEAGEVNKNDKIEVAKTFLSKITSSPWFTRTWTFQEGILSKQTIFMFDDVLVDGRFLAMIWSGWQNDCTWKLTITPQVFITPLGWSYGAQENYSVNISLREALLAAGKRKKTIPVDVVHSILGLLPYGNKIEVNYQASNHKYTQFELEQALLKVFKRAFQEYHYKEILSWSGSCSSKYWYLPQIDENGLIKIEDLFLSDEELLVRTGNLNLNNEFALSKIGKSTLKGIQILEGHFIQEDNNKIIEIDAKIGSPGLLTFHTMEIVMPNQTEAIMIKKIRPKHSLKNVPQEMFIDMINREVILKSKQPKRYQQLVLEENLISQIEQLIIS